MVRGVEYLPLSLCVGLLVTVFSGGLDDPTGYGMVLGGIMAFAGAVCSIGLLVAWRKQQT